MTIDGIGRWCIIGAGPAGLACARRFSEQNIPFEVLERTRHVGGIWGPRPRRGSLYDSVSLISSKRLTAFSDMPMPKAYPDFPSRAQVLAYLEAYAERFQLKRHIQFGQAVAAVGSGGRGCNVTLESGEVRWYSGVVIAAGHHWNPHLPCVPGAFQGTVLHSSDYRDPAIFAGKRVLVVGSGNSGCDIAVESASRAAVTYHSIRSPCHYLPKSFLGRPTDEFLDAIQRLRLPRALERSFLGLISRRAFGEPYAGGPPRPDHDIGDGRVVINDDIPDEYSSGRVLPRPGLAGFRDHAVVFEDGTEESVDVVVFATGFSPLLPTVAGFGREEFPDMSLNIFHALYDDLAFVGLVQPSGASWRLFQEQASLLAAFIRMRQDDAEAAAAFLRRVRMPPASRQRPYAARGKRSEDPLRVERVPYSRELRRQLKSLQA